jgi:hypothetical protein
MRMCSNRQKKQFIFAFDIGMGFRFCFLRCLKLRPPALPGAQQLLARP